MLTTLDLHSSNQRSTSKSNTHNLTTLPSYPNSTWPWVQKQWIVHNLIHSRVLFLPVKWGPGSTDINNLDIPRYITPPNIHRETRNRNLVHKTRKSWCFNEILHLPEKQTSNSFPLHPLNPRPGHRTPTMVSYAPSSADRQSNSRSAGVNGSAKSDRNSATPRRERKEKAVQDPGLKDYVHPRGL